MIRQPWMASAPVPTGAPRPIPMTDTPQQVGERRAHFVKIGQSNQVDLLGPQNTKVRITLLHGPSGLVIHVKGLTCFVSHIGGRPSAAVQIHHPSDVALVTPRAQEIGHLRIAIGSADGARQLFTIGADIVAIAADDCNDPILFDFGPGSDAYFVYTRGRTIPKSTRRG